MRQMSRIALPPIKLDDDFIVSHDFISEYETSYNVVRYSFYVPILQYSDREYLVIPELDNKLPGHSLLIDFGEDNGRESILSTAYRDRKVFLIDSDYYYKAEFMRSFPTYQSATKNMKDVAEQVKNKVTSLYSSAVSDMIVPPQKIEIGGSKSYLYTTFADGTKNKFVSRFYYLPYHYRSSIYRNVENGYGGFLHKLTKDPNFKYVGIRKSNNGVKQYYVVMIQESIDKALSYVDIKSFYQNKAKEDIEAIQNGYKHAMESFAKEKEDKKDFTVHNIFGDIQYTAVTTYSYLENEDRWHMKASVRLFVPSNSAISDLFVNAMETIGFKNASNPAYSVNIDGKPMDIHYINIGSVDTNTIEDGETKAMEFINKFHSAVQKSVMLAMQTRRVER